MTTYIGTNLVTATPMTRAEYNKYRGWELPANENGSDDGYLVEQQDGADGNDNRHAGYISWNTKAQFNGIYQETTGLTFGLALAAMKVGKRVSRAGWNGKGMWLTVVGTSSYDVASRLFPNRNSIEPVIDLLPWIGMKTADGKFVPWLASQTDVLADDWVLVI